MTARGSFFAALVLFLVSGNSVHAQLEGLMEAAQQITEMENEQDAQNNQGTNSNQGDNGMTPQQEEWQRQWEAEWEAQQEEEFYNSLNSKYSKCIALMANYVYMYLKLTNEHQFANTSVPPCDAYGMETLVLASSTTIMYCPEDMSKLSHEELAKIVEEFKDALTQFRYTYGHSPKISDKFTYIIDRIRDTVEDQDAFGDFPDSTRENDEEIYYIKYMIELFRPRYIIPRTLKIGQEMEAMGCSG